MIIDQDVEDVLCFIRRHILLERRVGVAETVGQLARMMWGSCPRDTVSPLYFGTPPTTDWPVMGHPPTNPGADGKREQC